MKKNMKEESHKVLQNLLVDSYGYRGQIIGDLIHLERFIDEAISRHLCNDKEKRKELFELILGNERVSFSNKIQVFQFISQIP